MFSPGNKSQVIYCMVLGTVIILIAALPVIRISISIQSRGIIRPLTEIAEIRVIPSAPVTSVLVSEGNRVKKGDTLFMLDSEGINSRLACTRQELLTIRNYISDLQNLISGKVMKSFASELYRTQNINFSRKKSEIDFRIEMANTEVIRQNPLYEGRLISKKEYEELLNFRDQLENERKVMETSQSLQWRSDLAANYSKQEGYASQIIQLEKERELYIIRSPVKGTVESFSGIYPGCNLQSGQVVAVISPDNTLMAEVFVDAKNAGLLHKGMPVRIQVDAFNYNEWGMISGKITRISDDYVSLNHESVFKVLCSLDFICLQLRNGVKGQVKKGMTVNARFLIAKRSLLQLLYEKSDDWLNPTRNVAPL